MKTDYSIQNNIKIKIKSKNTTQYIDINKISHLICDSYITTIYTIHKDPIVVSKLLKDFESNLEEFEFVRINRSTIVNMAFVKKYIGSKNRIVELINGDIIKVSRRRVYKFK